MTTYKNLDSWIVTETQIALRKLNDYGSPAPPSELKEVDPFVIRDDTHRDELFKTGIMAIKRNEVAFLVLSAGQGTRLGSSDPKGMMEIPFPNPNPRNPVDTLITHFAKKTQALQTLASKYEDENGEITGIQPAITFILMTAPEINIKIKKFVGTEIVEKKILKSGQIIIVDQDIVPCLTFDGNVIPRSEDTIQVSPNGNGGILQALEKINDDMKARRIKYVHVISVDNLMAKVCDPLAIGIMISEGAEVLNKVIERVKPDEPCGLMVQAKVGDNLWKSKVVEYSEIDPALAQARNADESLKFKYANICNHFFTFDFLEDLYMNEVRLPYHKAIKKVGVYDENTCKIVAPTKPNAVKLERFIFDLFDHAKKVVTMTVQRNLEFSPIKNPNDANVDCMNTAMKSLYTMYDSWLDNYELQQSVVEYNKVALHQFYLDSTKTYAGEDLDGYFTVKLPSILTADDGIPNFE
uniref:UDP-N-acetylglucosamine pyrophosphorylase n=1 Tax=Rhabditophanes sp. KR3021 TaxID=114890 RepID=A0AC35TM30_9BILA